MPRMTAVLPNYNNEAFLARTLTSLVNQTLSGLEIIVIDDCSTDSSADIIHYYASKYKKLKYKVLKERKGAAYCRNIGNNIASSNLIMVCDSGDINHKNRAKDAYGFFKERKDIDIYSTTCIETNMLDEQVEVHVPRIFNDKEKPSLFHPTVVYRKTVTDTVKYREGNMSTDQYEAFFLTAYKQGYKFHHSFEAMVKKLKHTHNPETYAKRMEQRLKNYKEFGIEVQYA